MMPKEISLTRLLFEMATEKRPQDISKTASVARRFIEMANEQGPQDMTPLKLLKICYIAHGWMLGLHNRPLIQDTIEAWQHGPVIPALYDAVRKYKRSHIPSVPKNWPDSLDGFEESIIKQTYKEYGKSTAGQLVALTHAEGTPWHKVWDSGYGKFQKIPDGLIRRYYAGLAGR